ncbi:hypothetical protein ILUMI_24604 [Ignelater luminosus]|uniref:Uncharacterized protein n=1 Tax=Ignelater luminosus TaxID=2038154 RepID=A0A8K0C8U5_IGNLU|nr:hypothetical protein ILUMI_24604 [Ignelater luminosus]
MCFLFYFFIFAVLYTYQTESRCIVSEDLQPLNLHQEECIAELSLDRETMALLSTQEFPPEDNFDCNRFYSCFWKKQGFQDEFGQINYHALEGETFNFLCQQVGSSEDSMEYAKYLAKRSVNDCKTVTGTSDGQKAVKFHNCIYRRLFVLVKQPEDYKNI